MSKITWNGQLYQLVTPRQPEKTPSIPDDFPDDVRKILSTTLGEFEQRKTDFVLKNKDK